MDYEIKFDINKDRFYIANQADEMIAEVVFVHAAENIIILNHTFVDSSLRGQGIAKLLVDQVVEYARSNNLKIKPTCSYAKKILQFDSYKDVLIN